jgi:hypothetical protein
MQHNPKGASHFGGTYRFHLQFRRVSLSRIQKKEAKSLIIWFCCFLFCLLFGLEMGTVYFSEFHEFATYLHNNSHPNLLKYLTLINTVTCYLLTHQFLI